MFAGCEWAYAVLTVAALLTVRVGGDRWGWATAVAYGPRVVGLLPGAVLVAIGGWRWVRRRGVPWVSAVAVAVWGVGVLGFNVPWRATVAADGSPRRVLRLLELNANGGDPADQPYDPVALAAVVARERPDVLALAEWRAEDPLPGGPWDARHYGDVTLASRFPIRRSAVWSAGPLGGEGAVVGCELAAPGGPVWCFALHLETPRRGFEPLLRRAPGAWRLLAESVARRRRLSDVTAAFVRGTAGTDDVLIAGDFNAVADGAIFRHAWGGWDDAFGRAGWGWGWTKWQWGWGVRIDHVLTGGRWHARRCRVGPDVRSDHLPLLAEVDAAAR